MISTPQTLKDFIGILKRRRLGLVLTIMIVFALTMIVTFCITPMYKSKSIILIEEQEIPRDFVMSAISSYAEQQLQMINQRIMSTAKLLEVIKKYNLYPEYRDRWTTEEIVERMRKKDIQFETISAEVMDRRTGRPTVATIAFSLTYKGKDPAKVQQVANVLASLYLEENLKAREEQAQGASKFLEDEANNVKIKLGEMEAKIAPFKEKNFRALPEVLQVNMQTLEQIDRDIDRLTDELRALREKDSTLLSQLANTPPDLENQDRQLLKELKAQLVQLESKFSDRYPDVKKTKVQIAELERRIHEAPTVNLSTKPDGKSVKAELVNEPDNPAYTALSAQLAGNKADMESVKRQIADLQKKRDEYRGIVTTTPRVEEKYKEMLVERNNMQVKYDELTKKYMDARVSQGLEKGKMGERFTLIEPAILPEKPYMPNIPMFALIGLVMGIGSGIGFTALREFNDTSVRRQEDLALITDLPLLAAIPDIILEKDRIRMKSRRARFIISTAAGIVLAIIIFHFFIMDLDIFWIKLSKRLVF